MKKREITIRSAIIAVLLLCSVPLAAQNPTASGTINATLINQNGIALVFNSDPSGVTLGSAGTSAATLNFGNVSAYGPLSAGVSRPSVTAANFTVRSLFDIEVTEGGLTSTSYTLRAQLGSPPPTGFSFRVDGITLQTVALNIQTNGAYNLNVQHNLDLVVSTAAPGAGGPAVGTPLSTVINFQATAN